MLYGFASYKMWMASYTIICIGISTLIMEAGPSQQVVLLTEVDVPGASLEEPMDKHSIPALKQWLLCRGIEMSSSVRKGQLLDK